MPDQPPSGSDSNGYTSLELLREVVLTGIAVVIPAVISIYLLILAVSFLSDLLSPLSVLFPGDPAWTDHVIAVGVLGVTILLVGFFAHFRTGERAVGYFDAAIERIPGIGAIYRSFRRMSDIMLSGDADHFRGVKLVPFPDESSYVIGFETSITPERITSATGVDSMRTLFVPMGPNPFMGGFVMHVAADRLVDVDLSVEEGIRATVTSGVVISDEDSDGTFEGPTWEWSDIEAVPKLAHIRDVSIARLEELDTDRVERKRLKELEEEIKSLNVEELENRLVGDQTDPDLGDDVQSGEEV